MPTKSRFPSKEIKEIALCPLGYQPQRKRRLSRATLREKPYNPVTSRVGSKGKQIKRFACFPHTFGKNHRCPCFVIHKHHARNLHYDFRLETNKVLKSWAIPKQPPKTKGIKRLAIQVEDHPLNYASFEGTIPKGNYGAGTVEIWDKGTYELIKKTKGKIEFKLNGKKLKGNYVLVNAKLGKNKNGWLFFKI